MKQNIFYFSIILFIITVYNTYSTWSRTSALGIPFWMIQEDDTLIWLNPYEIKNYPNQVFIEFGTASGSTLQPNVNGNLSIGNQWGGLSFNTDFVYPGTFGVFFARPYWGLVNASGHQVVGSDVTTVANSPLGTSMLPSRLYNKLDLFWSGVVFGFPIGLSAFIASNSSYKNSSNVTQPYPTVNDLKYTEKTHSTEIWLMMGTRFKQIYIFDIVDVVLNLGLHNVDNSYIDQQYDGNIFLVNDNYRFITKGVGSIEITLRSIYKPRDNVAVITLCDYFLTDLSNEFIRKTDTNLDGNLIFSDGDIYYKRNQIYNNSFITISGATNVYLTKKLLWIIGTSVVINNLQIEENRYQMFVDRKGIDQEYKYEKLGFTVPFYLACEYEICKFLKLRSGVNKVVYGGEFVKTIDPDYDNWDGARYPIKNITETTTEKETTSDYTTNVSLGAKFQFKDNLYIDFVLRQNVLFTGTYFVSGVPETLVSQITAVYKF
ncbi:MAG: hypothetical protein NZ839_03995 [Endomicrobia bacterium]|nr:hypothetical protein [Endomicrobiia bacterium]